MEMKALQIFVLTAAVCIPFSSTEMNLLVEPTYEEVKTQPTEDIIKVDSLNVLVDALIAVESSGNDSAVGDQGRAIGVLQIHPITVREVNRILSLKGSSEKYILSDRWSRIKSIQMFDIWKSHHLPKASLEVVARTWNGGTRYRFSKDATEYWKKVKYNLDVRKKDLIFRKINKS